jgi:hypothetical protein
VPALLFVTGQSVAIEEAAVSLKSRDMHQPFFLLNATDAFFKAILVLFSWGLVLRLVDVAQLWLSD